MGRFEGRERPCGSAGATLHRFGVSLLFKDLQLAANARVADGDVQRRDDFVDKTRHAHARQQPREPTAQAHAGGAPTTATAVQDRSACKSNAGSPAYRCIGVEQDKLTNNEGSPGQPCDRHGFVLDRRKINTPSGRNMTMQLINTPEQFPGTWRSASSFFTSGRADAWNF